jgi:hypothetical protein
MDYKTKVYKKNSPYLHDIRFPISQTYHEELGYVRDVRKPNPPDFSAMNGRWMSSKKAIEWVKAMRQWLVNLPDEEDLFELKIRMIQTIEWDKLCSIS